MSSSPVLRGGPLRRAPASSVAAARCGPIRVPPPPRRVVRPPRLTALIGLEPSDGVVLVDVENVRGKSGFTLGHEELLGEAACPTPQPPRPRRPRLDHGARTAAYYLRQLGLAVAFSGRRSRRTT